MPFNYLYIYSCIFTMALLITFITRLKTLYNIEKSEK